jgi:hypothetical protein
MCHEIKDYARMVEVASLAERGMHEKATANKLKRLAIEEESKLTIGKGYPLELGNMNLLVASVGEYM